MTDRPNQSGAAADDPRDHRIRDTVADYTSSWTAERWLYVAAVIDLFSRRVVDCRGR
jgi:transposase InsO family protein